MTGSQQSTVGDENVLGPLLDSAPCGFVSFADDGTVQVVNQTLLDLLGESRAELAGRHVERMLTIGSRIFYQTHFFPLLRLHGHVEEVFLLLRTSDGGDLGALVNAVRRERNGVYVTECVLMPVRERRKFEDALLRARRDAEEARAAAEQQRHDVEQANAQLEAQALELELSQDQLEEQAEELEQQAEELGTINDELIARTEELERQRLIADDANRAKSAFLTRMSHELRTPLNAIGGYVQLLEMGIHGAITEPQGEALSKIARSQRHLLRLINEVLNLARVEAGRVDYELRPTPIIEIVEAVLPMIEPQLAACGLHFEQEVPAGVLALVDREKTEQILLNILSNAIKFTPRGGRISVNLDATPDDHTHVRLRVRDTGIGIPADRLEQVFDPFVQVDVSHTRRAEGTGLGLAISRDLARGMGGDLTAESTLDVGSTFVLTLPRP